MESPTSDKKCTYFSLVIPEEDSAITQDKSVVATSLKDLQPLLKRNTHARFRAFTNYEDAFKYIKFPDAPECVTPSKLQSKPRGRASLPNTIRTGDTRSLSEERERANNFPTPKPQDMALVNSYITRRLNNKLSDVLKLNPRLLCSDCDVAPAVHEGTRLNALHAAAKNNNYQAAQMILEIISSISFFEKLYPKDNPVTRSERCRHLNISYLNTPDKMLLETPLHYAAKFNAIDVLKLLVVHPLCNLDPRNDQGHTPVEIAGSRCSGQNHAQEKQEVVRILQEIYIVPIWRDVLSASPRVGMYGKWHSYRNKLPQSFHERSFNLPVELLPPFDESLVPFSKSGEMAEISSYAGPTTEEKAKEFYRLLKESSGRKIAENPLSPFGSPGPSSPSWGTPPKSSPIHSPAKVLSGSPISSKDLVLPTTPSKLISVQSRADMSLRMEDGVKGLERLCRKYAKQLNIPWMEFWKFLDTFCNLETRFGLELLESFLISKENEIDAAETYEDASYNDGNGTMMSSLNSSWSCLMNSSKLSNKSKDPVFGDATYSDTVSPRRKKSDETLDFLIERLDSMHINNSPQSPVDQSPCEKKPKNYSPQDYLDNTLIDYDDVKGINGMIDPNPLFPQKEDVKMDITKMCWDYRDLMNTSNSTIATDLDFSYNCPSDTSMEINDIDEDDDDDRYSFITAATHDEADEEEFEECLSCAVYIDGVQAKENDRQVFYAIKDVFDDDIFNQYPAISRWYNSLKANGYFRTKDPAIKWNSSNTHRQLVGSACSPVSEHQQTATKREDIIRDTKRVLDF